MLKKAIPLGALIFLLIAGCNRNEDADRKQEPASTDSVKVIARIDPGPTDSVGAGGYEPQTDDMAKAALFRKVLPVILEKELIGTDSTARLLKFDGKSYRKNPSVAPKFTGKLSDEFPRALMFATKPYPWFTF